MRWATAPLILALFAGCHAFDKGLEDYYEDRSDPVVTSMDVTSEPGNAGGRLRLIEGSNFGDDLANIVVTIGSHNAEVLSVTDSAIEIITPVGPITGGPVDLMVGSKTGFAVHDDFYTYDIAALDGTSGDFYADERSYVLASNMFSSCYGGVGPPGCENVTFSGQTGTTGDAQFLDFAYPRVHTVNQGWLTGHDTSIGEWKAGRPDLASPAGITNLRNRMSQVQLINPAFEGQETCVDLAENQYTIVPCDDNAGASQRAYDRGKLDYCEGDDPESGGDYVYRTDWPMPVDFFDAGTGDITDPVAIKLRLPDLIDGDVDLLLPPAVVISSVAGWDDFWVNGMDDCLDADGSGDATLDEEGLVLGWEPITSDAMSWDEFLAAQGDQVIDVQSYVMHSVSYLPFGWFGLEAERGVRASLAVTDTHQFDSTTGLSSVGIPNEIMYQIPAPNAQWSGQNDFTQRGFLGTYDSNAAYLFVEIYRVVDYRIQTSDGELIFSYVTGDLNLPGWDNPKERGTCASCYDEDGDGWTDGQDPDCNPGVGGQGEEDDHLFGAFTCNDGLDNNNDGLIDAEDPLCADGWDGETTCTDGLDNDGDGWIDLDDPGCLTGENEDDGFAGNSCNDDVDDDGDGWFDAMDPDCADGHGDGGTGERGLRVDLPCNDGIDNDGYGDIDAADVFCFYSPDGAFAAGETRSVAGHCRDGNDNDGDGLFDIFDPDCERIPYSREDEPNLDPAIMAPACYDGIDNDGDGAIDGFDTSCWLPSFDYNAVGYWGDESSDWGTGCSDKLDEDGDGWFDAEDPDCAQGDPLSQDEVGFGTTQCNDGIDNDNDGFIDRDDSTYCHSATGNYEGPG